MSELWCICANIEGDKLLRDGSKVYILHCNGDAEKPIVKHRNIKKYTHFKKLRNFRAAFVPDSLRGDVIRVYDTKNAAAEAAKVLDLMWAPIKNGVPASQAFKTGNNIKNMFIKYRTRLSHV